jgi:hypothetical protein
MKPGRSARNLGLAIALSTIVLTAEARAEPVAVGTALFYGAPHSLMVGFGSTGPFWFWAPTAGMEVAGISGVVISGAPPAGQMFLAGTSVSQVMAGIETAEIAFASSGGTLAFPAAAAPAASLPILSIALAASALTIGAGAVYVWASPSAQYYLASWYAPNTAGIGDGISSTNPLRCRCDREWYQAGYFAGTLLQTLSSVETPIASEAACSSQNGQTFPDATDPTHYVAYSNCTVVQPAIAEQAQAPFVGIQLTYQFESMDECKAFRTSYAEAEAQEVCDLGGDGWVALSWSPDRCEYGNESPEVLLEVSCTDAAFLDL